MENPIIPKAAKFRYKIPSLRTLTVMETISWSRGDVRIERVVDLEAVRPQLMRREHFPPPCWPPPPLDTLVLKTVQRNVIIIIIITSIIIIIVVELLLLLSMMILIIGFLVLRPASLSLLQSAIGISKVRQNKPPTNSK